MIPNSGCAAVPRSRHSPVWLSRLAFGGLVMGAGMLAVLIGAGLFLAYRITTTHNGIENVTPASYLLANYENLNFADARGGEHEGWLLVGLKGAPAIILCHGYNSNRSELLSLGTSLQANHFNVYLFNFGGPRSKGRFSALGVRESSTLLAGIRRVTEHPAVNPHRVGLYGATVGGYAALVASQENPSVRALVVDSAYEDPTQMFDYQVDRLVGGAGSLFRFISRVEFRLIGLGAAPPHLWRGFPQRMNCPTLFLASEDAPALKALTQDLYRHAPEPKRLLVLPHAQPTLVSGAERKAYENQVLSFFLQNLPPRVD